MIDREEEMNYLLNFVYSEPDLPLILHGPKSIGKSTLLRALTQSIDINAVFIDFRAGGGYGLFSTRAGFAERIKRFFDKIFGKKQIFPSFEVSEPEEPEEAIPEILDFIEREDVGVVILDELQEARFLTTRYAKEIFSLLVALAKNEKLCNVIIATSDPIKIFEKLMEFNLERDFHLFRLWELPREAVFRWGFKLGIPERVISRVYRILGGRPLELGVALSSQDPEMAAQYLYSKERYRVEEAIEREDISPDVLQKLLEGKVKARSREGRALYRQGIAYPGEALRLLFPESTLVQNILLDILGGKKVKKKKKA